MLLPLPQNDLLRRRSRRASPMSPDMRDARLNTAVHSFRPQTQLK
jgi:hypothetical protein